MNSLLTFYFFPNLYSTFGLVLLTALLESLSDLSLPTDRLSSPYPNYIDLPRSIYLSLKWPFQTYLSLLHLHFAFFSNSYDSMVFWKFTVQSSFVCVCVCVCVCVMLLLLPRMPCLTLLYWVLHLLHDWAQAAFYISHLHYLSLNIKKSIQGLWNTISLNLDPIFL